MGKFIETADLNNTELQLLPIRRGCSGICACLGTCKTIVGYIERKEYDDFIKTYVDSNTFLTNKCNENLNEIRRY
jgi:hypothetical protein